MGLLEGKVAVITGAGSGMGKASAKVFVREGARVVIGDISGAEQDTAAEIGERTLPLHCDVTKEPEVEAMFRAAVEEYGRVDAVLNVAGGSIPERLHELTMEAFDGTVDLSLRSALLGMKHGIRAMLDHGDGGAIVNWSSLAGLNALTYGTASYSASKAGVIAVTKAAAVEYGSQGIRANVICPGFILTEIMGARGATDHPDMFEKAALGRAGAPIEVAEVAAFLASDKASFVTGATIPVDGGWVAKLA